jgi:hypothetical protein
MNQFRLSHGEALAPSQPSASGGVRSDWAYASRLALFLWNSAVLLLCGVGHSASATKNPTPRAGAGHPGLPLRPLPGPAVGNLIQLPEHGSGGPHAVAQRNSSLRLGAVFARPLTW